MNRSDSTTPPSGSSIRTGPCTITGPDGDDAHRARLRIGHGFSALMTTSSSSRRPGSSRPVSSSHAARDDSTGPNGIHWYATTSASSPAPDNVASVSTRYRELRLHDQKGAAGSQQIGHRRATAVPARGGRRGRHPMRVPTRWSDGSGCGRRVGIVRDIRRVADDQVERAELRGARPRAQVHVDVDADRQSVHARTPDGLRTHVERGDLRRSLLARRDGHHPTAGAQVGYPTTERQPALLHHVDEELGVRLRGVNALCRNQ